MQRLPNLPPSPAALQAVVIAVVLAALLAVPAAPVAAQGVPDNVPDVPGESPADRAQEQFVERHRDFLSRLFTTGSVLGGPLPPEGLAYQTNIRAGLEFRSGDALFVAFNRWMLPDRPRPRAGDRSWLWYAGLGYTVSGARLSGWSEVAARTALSTELGVWRGETSVVALDLSPRYEVLRGDTWSIPAGVRFSVARISGPDGAVVQPFVGLTVGAKMHIFARERLESK